MLFFTDLVFFCNHCFRGLQKFSLLSSGMLSLYKFLIDPSIDFQTLSNFIMLHCKLYNSMLCSFTSSLLILSSPGAFLCMNFLFYYPSICASVIVTVGYLFLLFVYSPVDVIRRTIVPLFFHLWFVFQRIRLTFEYYFLAFPYLSLSFV